MKRKTILMQGRRMAVAVCGLLIGAAMMQSCEDDALTGQPSWLGNSIYERLQEEGNYTTMLRLIDDVPGQQKEVLSRTGSKTLFVADDDAFNKWFQANDWGVSSYEQLSDAQKKLLFNNAMINNAYLIELLSNLSGNPVQQGKCMRRPTASQVTDSITVLMPKDMPNTLAWQEHKNRTEGMYIFKDRSASPMIHFLPAFMRVNNISGEDLSILTNGRSNTIEDSWVNGKKVVERDITCKNGYIQKVDGVIEANPNMADIIRAHKNMSMWSHLLDRFSAPYYVGGLDIEETGRQLRVDSVYEWRYFSDMGYVGSNEVYPDGVNTAAATLKFDPGWNSYYNRSSTQNSNIYSDAAAMLVPSNAALQHWWDNDGAVLQEQYHEWDSIPDLVLSKLINVNMLTSLIDAVPSKFPTILDDSKMEMGVQTSNIDSCFMGCNGVVYMTNRVFSPRAYSSVSFPALIHQDVMSIIYWAITHLDLEPYLNSMESRYSFIIPTNDAMLRYIDPTSYKQDKQILYEFMFDASAKDANRVKAVRYNVERDELTGEWVKTGQPLGTVTAGNPVNGVDLVKNRLEDLMDALIIVGDIEDGQEYYKTKGGSMIRVTNPGVVGQMTISGGFQLENNEPLVVTTIYDQSHTGNGKSYVVESEPVMGASTSVYSTLEAHEEFAEFSKLLNGSDGNVKHDLLISTNSSYRAIDKNMRLFEKFNYTVYVPTNEAILELVNEGYLPTWDDFDAQTLEAWNDDKDKMDAAKEAIATRIFNFVRYHIQDNAVYIGAEPVSDLRYETAKLNPENNRFFSLLVNADPNGMNVTDQLGVKHDVIMANGLYNLMCREYWFTGLAGTSSRSINSASDAVVHQINGVLLYDNSLKNKKWADELEEIRNAN